MAEDSSNNTEVFVYTEGAVVPEEVVRVRVHPSVTVIPEEAFCQQERLEEVELCEGLLEVGKKAFAMCKLLRSIRIPSTVTVISDNAFSSCRLGSVDLGECEGLVKIGDYAFASTRRLTQLRIPPLITTIPMSMVSCSRTFFSSELPTSVMQLQARAFFACHFLRNIALPLDAGITISTEGTFRLCTDLLQLFDTDHQIINALQHRFDSLPIHKMIYYQSYNNVTSDELNNATDIRISRRRSKLNPTGKQQDCLGMTPLHIMACSTVQDTSLYRVLVDKYPENLITEDRWGEVPLLYAVWGNAPSEIIQFLVDSYKSIYPNYEFDWTGMMKTLGTVVASMSELDGLDLNGLGDIIQNILDLQEEYFPDQKIDWKEALDNLVAKRVYQSPLVFFTKCSIKKRVSAIGLQHFRDAIMKKMDSTPTRGREFLTEVETMLN